MAAESNEDHAIRVHLDRLLAERGMTLAELASRAGVTNVNLSILKNGRARAIRFTTLTRICQALECQPGDLLSCYSDRNSTAPDESLPVQHADRPSQHVEDHLRSQK